MAVRLKYQQGSFRREEMLDSEAAAILRATALALSGCLYFELTDANGDVLKRDHDVRKPCAGSLRIA
jgi:hypothetical protein